jgi:predicted amidohydrolase/GNAT superfamily N-acetyltransferase
MAQTKNQGRVLVRQARAEDVPGLIELNRAAYPTLAEDNVVWGRSHLLSHQRVFPQGQIVAELDGKIVGGSAALIVDLGRDPLRHHTWSGITDSGYFYNHTSQGDTLYGADVCVHPEHRCRGIGRMIYDARKELVKRLNLRRILLGGRLYNYHLYADRYTPHEYAQRVINGEISDPVLHFQVREGFVLRGILPNYLRDPLSKNNASLLEWLNPDYKARPSSARKVRVACVQYQMRKVKSFKEFAQQVKYFTGVAADYDCDFLLFPELFTVQLLSHFECLAADQAIRKLTEFTDQFRELMTGLAKKHDVTIIAGSHPMRQEDKIVNTALVCLPDGSSVHQPKIHVTPNEKRNWGISGGNHLAAIDTPTAKIGVLICYDIEFPEASRLLADQGAEIIFVPFCTDNRQGYLRVRYCAQARAIENQVYVALAGNVGNLPDVNNMHVNYGQAAVLTPSDFAFARDGIAAESDSSEETILVCDLDLDDLHESRSGGTVTPRLDRRPDLFQIITAFAPGKDAPHVDGPRGDQPETAETSDDPLMI